MTLMVRVVAPDRTIWDAEADEVVLPSTTGQLGILSNHAPLLTALDTGVMRVRAGKDWTPIALMGGFAEVESNEVTILVNGGEQGSSIDKDEAKAAFEAAQAQFNQAQQSDNRQAFIQASQRYKRARARYQAAGGMI